MYTRIRLMWPAASGIQIRAAARLLHQEFDTQDDCCCTKGSRGSHGGDLRDVEPEPSLSDSEVTEAPAAPAAAPL